MWQLMSNGVWECEHLGLSLRVRRLFRDARDPMTQWGPYFYLVLEPGGRCRRGNMPQAATLEDAMNAAEAAADSFHGSASKSGKGVSNG
jgi:hypothetical protein